MAWHVARHALGLAPKPPEKTYEIGDVAGIMKGVSVYSFREGMSMLVRTLEAELIKRGNVKIVKGEGVETVTRSAPDKITVRVVFVSALIVVGLIIQMDVPHR